MSQRSALQFAAWLKEAHPQIYKRAVKAADIAVAQRAEAATKVMERNNLSGLGVLPMLSTSMPTIMPTVEEEAKTGWFNTFLQTAAGLGTTYLTLKNQQDQMDLNIERAKMGLQPLNIAQQPILTTQVQLPQGTVDKIMAGAGTQMNKVLLFAGVGLIAFMLLR